MAFITEDSDEDSISLTSTVDSEHSSDAGFSVEQILAEGENDQGITEYLVKWEGYPLDRCTWEPEDQFVSDLTLNVWKERKRDAARGGKPLFDVDEFNAAFEQAAEEKESRQNRRKAKRRRRGEMISRSQSPAVTGMRKPAPPRPTAAASPPKRKGVAQKVVKSNTAQAAPKPTKAKPTPAPAPTPARNPAPKPAQATAKRAQPARKTAPTGPLIGPDLPKLNRKPKARVSGETPKDSTAPKFRTLSEQNRYQNYSRNHPTPDINALTLIDPKTGKRISSQKPATEPVKQSSVPISPTAPVSLERRPSQPQVAQDTPAQAVKQTQATASKPTEPTTSVPNGNAGAGQTKSTDQPEKASKPTQPAPKLKSKVGIPQSRASSRPTEIHSPYGRRTPPVERRRRSPSPPLPQHKAQNAIQPSELPLDHPKRQICKWWQTGNCHLAADTCSSAHSYINTTVGNPKTKRVTCYYWQNGNKCNKTAEHCGFAHHDTGEYAGRPGTFLSRARSGQYPGPEPSANDVPVDYERRQKNIAAPVVDEPPPIQMDVEPAAKATEPATNVLVPPGHHSPSAAGLEDKVSDDLAVSTSSIQDDLLLAKKSIQGLEVSPFLFDRNGKPIEHVYILMPPAREEERQLLVDFFHGFNCKVYHSGNPQHWNFFRQISSFTLLVIHPQESFLGTLPKFASHLWRGKGWVFSFGVHDGRDWQDLKRPKRVYEARRVFPHAGITFISDDVFAYYPEKAAEMIEEFHSKAKVKPAGGELSKIGARPGIRDWLAKLAEENMEEGGENYTDDRYIKCWDAICDFCPIVDYDPFEMERGRMVPNNDALLWSVAEQDLPSLQGLWEKDEAAATEKMANFFAGTAVERMWEFQRYCFIYQRPDQTQSNENVSASQLAPQAVLNQVDPHGWMRKYNHIEVMTPDEWLHRFRKKP